MIQYVRIGLTTGLWTLSVLLLTVRTVDYDNMRLSALTAWAMFIALVAAVMTGWCLLVHERHRIQHIAEVVASECQRQLRSVD